MAPDATGLRLLNGYQRGFPLEPRPFARIGADLGLSEAEVLARFADLSAEGLISRIGPVVAPNRLGASTLAAMAVPEERLEEVARLVSARHEINHNYEREHPFNLWFVVAAPDEDAIQRVLFELEEATDLPVIDLPLVTAYHINLGFDLSCDPT